LFIQIGNKVSFEKYSAFIVNDMNLKLSFISYPFSLLLSLLFSLLVLVVLIFFLYSKLLLFIFDSDINCNFMLLSMLFCRLLSVDNSSNLFFLLILLFLFILILFEFDSLFSVKLFSSELLLLLLF
jgi:hypothetical protein